jgi:hypothetical protein
MKFTINRPEFGATIYKSVVLFLFFIIKNQLRTGQKLVGVSVTHAELQDLVLEQKLYRSVQPISTQRKGELIGVACAPFTRHPQTFFLIVSARKLKFSNFETLQLKSGPRMDFFRFNDFNCPKNGSNEYGSHHDRQDGGPASCREQRLS